MDKLSTEIAALKNAIEHIPASDIAGISSIAVNNLKAQLSDPNSAFNQDPQLMLDAAKVIAKMNTDTIEAQRRCLDTLIRYHAQQQTPVIPANPADNLLPEEVEAPEIKNPGSSTFA